MCKYPFRKRNFHLHVTLTQQNPKIQVHNYSKWKNCAIVPSGHWALNTMTTNCDPMRVKVFTCWSRVILMMIDVVMHGQVRVTWRARDFCLENSFVGRFIFQRVWIMITWSIIAQTLEILTDAYTSQSTLFRRRLRCGLQSYIETEEET